MPTERSEHDGGWLGPMIRFCLEQKLVVVLGVLMFVGWGAAVAPFDWTIDWLPREPVAVDAIPDIGENQQIVFTEWPGRSPQDVEDQITYPLTVSLLGIPGVKDIRSYSYFGFSTIYVIFDEDVEFYWSRSRILEKLNALSPGTLPEGVNPTLGPDATALGQVYWYTLEGRDPAGEPIGGWDLDELRSVQDWYVRYGLMSAEGVAEVASVGGFVREYQVDVDPDAMRAHGVTLRQIFNAVRQSNVDVGARTIEVNSVEYVVRGLGQIERIEDIQQAVVKSVDNVPITIDQVATVHLGPAMRRGALDRNGGEAVGGVVVARFGTNPLQAIKNVKQQIDAIEPGLPIKPVIAWDQVTPEAVRQFAGQNAFEPFIGEDASLDLNEDAWMTWLNQHDHADWPAWVNTSKITIVPFYDRSGLIAETLGTLNDALEQQVLITIIVVILMVLHLRSSLMISAMLPMAVLITFIMMKIAGVEANVVALAGIAIAIGTVVDVGIVMTENILRRLDEADADASRLEVVYRASTEVGSAVLTAVATTVVSFLPVFTMIGAEGKLFRPLAFTKTFVLIASIIVALTIIPPAAHLLLRRGFTVPRLPDWMRRWSVRMLSLIAALLVTWLLTDVWLPLGPAAGFIRNFIFVAVMIGGLLILFRLFLLAYEPILRWCLNHKVTFLTVPSLMIVAGLCVWLGAAAVFGWMPDRVEQTRTWRMVEAKFPGLGSEFMPSLDEGSFLFMPTTMPHASIGEAMDVLQKLDKAIGAIPEVEQVVGKIGRADSPLDPAPVSMVETVVNYKDEYIADENGRPIRFRYDRDEDQFVRDADGELIPDAEGRPYRQWRDHIRTPDDIWEAIQRVAQLPGTTGAPKLQPIETRLVMLQTGMRAPMGIKIKGPDLRTIEQVGVRIEQLLKSGQAAGVAAETVNADRIVGKPYLEIEIDRRAIQRYNLTIADVQHVIEIAIGGRTLTRTVEGRERYAVRVRYMRELRDDIESLGQVLVASPDGTQVPLIELASIHFVRGPQVIKSEDTFLIGYVTFDMQEDFAEVEVVNQTRAFLEQARDDGRLDIPAGVTYSFAGSYENQQRAAKTLAVVLPVSLMIIFLILYLQFRSTMTTGIIFMGILVAWAGGFGLIWCYGQPWFLNFDVFGMSMRQLFQVHPINLSVAVWVGFLALFGIATDDGVILATYLKQSFDRREPTSIQQIREATVAAGCRRIRPCLMTSATTILALIPVLTSQGRGADIMIPMAIPSFGGMIVVLITVFVVPTLYCAAAEIRWRRSR